jgi:hypothetical protein
MGSIPELNRGPRANIIEERNMLSLIVLCRWVATTSLALVMLSSLSGRTP